MILKNLPSKSALMVQLAPGLKWFKRHWTKVLLLSLCAFLALERNLTVDLHFSTSKPDISVQTKKPENRSHQTSLKETMATPLLVKNSSSSEKEKLQLEYINRFAKVAQAEQRKFAIPASIKLAQGLLESQAGSSDLALENNNHFGIKCFSRKCKAGHCRNFGDDTHKDFFRVYPNAWESYRAHSLLLSKKDRYQHLFQQDKHDYRSWAKGLANAGYATDPDYANKLIRLIETLELSRFDG